MVELFGGALGKALASLSSATYASPPGLILAQPGLLMGITRARGAPQGGSHVVHTQEVQ